MQKTEAICSHSHPPTDTDVVGLGDGANLADDVERRLGVHQKGDNQAVQTQNLGENENQDHADEQSRLLGSTAHTGVTDNADGETGGQTGQTDGQTSTELDEACVQGILGLLQVVGNQDGHNETVDTDNTSHNDGHNVYEGDALVGFER